eukprot:995841-Pleurochrysis_carterae.AAC.4
MGIDVAKVLLGSLCVAALFKITGKCQMLCGGMAGGRAPLRPGAICQNDVTGGPTLSWED